MQNKKNLSTVLVVILLLGAFLVLRAAIVGQLSNNIKDSDFEEDALKAAGCTAPTLSNIHVDAITSSSATIAWTTSQVSNTSVRLGLTSNNMTWLTTIDNPVATSGVTSHSYSLSSLQTGTKYYYRVRSSNGSCQKTSTTYSFTTLASTGGTSVDITAPTTPVSVSATNITPTSFTLNWMGSTDPVVVGAATSGVKGYEVYGPNGACNVNGSAGYCGTVLHTGVGIHSLAISGLVAGTTYSGSTGATAGFTLKAYDNVNNYSVGTARLSVTTPTTPSTTDTMAPSTPTSLTSTGVTPTSVSLSWASSTDNSGSVAGYKIFVNGSSTASNSSLVSGTTFTVNGLVASTTYSFTVKAYDATGNASASSAAYSTMTSPGTTADTVAPTKPTGLTATNITSTSFTLNWTASTDNVLPVSQIHYDVYGSTQVCNVNAVAGYCGAAIGTTSMNITGLSASTTYGSSAVGTNSGFVVQAYDTSFNYSAASNLLSVTTLPGTDTSAPVISNISSSVTSTTATVTWTTNEPATTVLDYGTSTSYGQNITNPLLVTNHVTTITGLMAGVTYHFHVRSADAVGNLSSYSADQMFSPLVATSCPNATTGAGLRQMWVWNDGGIVVTDVINTSTSASQTFFNFVDSHKVQVAYIQMAPGFFTATNSANLKNFLNVARDQHCLQIEALSGGSNWAAPYYDNVSAPTSTSNTWAIQVKNFNNTITGSNAKLLGLQYDVEPYLDSWSNTNNAAGIATNTRTINGLIDMLAEAKTTISGSGLMLDLAPPRWYDTQFALLPNVFIRRGLSTPQNKSAMKYLMDVVDIYTVQDYVVTGATLFADGRDEVAYGSQTGKKVRIGVEVSPGYGTSTSFADVATPTCTNLDTQLTSAYSQFSSAGILAGFDGFAVEYYPTWKTMCNF